MMSGVRNPPNHHPCPRSLCIKEFRLRFPPSIIFLPQGHEPLSAVLCISLHEFQSSLCRRKWRRANLNSQHVDEPQILAHALVHHLFVHAAPSPVARAWTHWKILVAEFTPHAHHFDPLGLISFHKKAIFHKYCPSARFRRKSSLREIVPSTCCSSTTGNQLFFGKIEFN